MSITELQTLILNAITMGVFLGFIIGILLSVFGSRNK